LDHRSGITGSKPNAEHTIRKAIDVIDCSRFSGIEPPCRTLRYIPVKKQDESAMRTARSQSPAIPANGYGDVGIVYGGESKKERQETMRNGRNLFRAVEVAATAHGWGSRRSPPPYARNARSK
jgi:hypothetical protein